MAASNTVPPEALARSEDAPRVHALAFDWARDGVITGVAGVLWISTEALFKSRLAPATCRWCDRAPDGTDRLNALDAWGRGLAGSTPEAQKRADTWSNVVDFVMLPAGVFGGQYLLAAGNGAPLRYYLQDAAIVLETVALSSALNQVVKFSVGRERPFVHVLPESEKALTERPTDNNLSFYSGHTNLAFALVVAAGTVAELRDYRHRWLVWALGLPVATTVPLLRMAADKHYLTDVVVGAVAGTAFGLAVPLLLHGREQGQEGAPGMTMQFTGGLGSAVLVGSF